MKIFNLDFPHRCSEIDIFGYRFKKIENYKNQIRKLQHLSGSFSEFEIKANTGQHAITAEVTSPNSNENTALKWTGNSTPLDDILLLLSIFTGRDVFAIDDNQLHKESIVFLADSRVYSWGGILQCSIPYRGQKIESGDEDDELEYNIGFEEGINQIYDLIRSSDWQSKYQQGEFLFTARTAFRRQPLNSAFLQCWIIWEHLFSVINHRWLSEKQIHSLSAVNKMAFLLVEYGLIDSVEAVNNERIEKLCSIRNRLVHYGSFPEPTIYFKNAPKHTEKIQKYETILSDADLFVRLTEHILAKILGLTPSDVFNTEDNFKKYLKRNERI